MSEYLRVGIVAVSVLLMAVPRLSVAAVKQGAVAAPFMQSTLALQQKLRLVGLNPAAELTHNPYYAMQALLQPRWDLGAAGWVAGGISLQGELTQSDVNTDPILWGDTWLAYGHDDLLALNIQGMSFGAQVQLTLPTSLAARAATHILSADVGMHVRQRWQFEQSKLVLTGYVNFLKHWHHATTVGRAARLTSGCFLALAAQCGDETIYSGRRNAWAEIRHAMLLEWHWRDWFIVEAGVGAQMAFLHDFDVGDVSYRSVEVSSTRYFISTRLAIRTLAIPYLNIALGVRADHLQLGLDGRVRVPFMNRYAQLFLQITWRFGTHLQDYLAKGQV